MIPYGGATAKQNNQTVPSMRALVKEFPKTQSQKISKLNRAVFRSAKKYLKEENILTAALVQNLFGTTPDLVSIQRAYGAKVANSLKIMNQLFEGDISLFDKKCSNWPEATLFLVNMNFYFQNRDRYPEEIGRILTKKRTAYALRHLDYCNVYELRHELEDQLFSFLKPDVYQHYCYFLDFARKDLDKREREVTTAFSRFFNKAGSRVDIQSRVKTVYSIHKKIRKKKILYSHVLDTVGLRLIVASKNDCYETMNQVLKQSDVMPGKIKDYIALPKSNGYQSIHLTIMFKGYPVEVQIRTRQMDRVAKYGSAKHSGYKNGGAE